MTNKNNLPACDRKEDLIAYLYDEANKEERGSFERHLVDCHSCRDELNAFARVRDDLSVWELGTTPRTEIVLPGKRQAAWPEFSKIFPAWARGLALSAASLSLLLFALSFAGILPAGDSAMNSPRIEMLVNDAVARESARIEQQYRAQAASYREQLKAEYELQFNALRTQQEAKLEAAKVELKRFNRQNSSIRSFFAMDDADDPFGDYR
jgi:anti-sigma factor RsiW